PATVDFSSTTRFTKSSTVSRSSLAKGECVSVAAASRPALGTGSAGAQRRPPRKVTARSVTITSTSRCSQPPAGGTFRGRSPEGTPPTGGFGSGNGSTPLPDITRSPNVGGGAGLGPGTFRTFTGGAFGTVSSITASSFTITPVFARAGTTTVRTTTSTTYQASS